MLRISPERSSILTFEAGSLANSDLSGMSVFSYPASSKDFSSLPSKAGITNGSPHLARISVDTGDLDPGPHSGPLVFAAGALTTHPDLQPPTF